LQEAGDASFEPLYNRAGLEIRAGSMTAAVSYFRKAANAQPDSADAALGLSLARRALLERPGF